MTPKLARNLAAAVLFFISASRVSVSAQVLFHDDFTAGYSASWSILNQNNGRISPQPTYLDLTLSPGDLFSSLNNAGNVFLLTNPTAGDFVATAHLKSPFSPTADPQKFYVIAFDSVDNFARFGYSFESGQRFTFIQTETGGSPSGNAIFQDLGAGDLWFALRKQGNSYAGFLSTDGVNFTASGPAMTFGDGTPLQIGFGADGDASSTKHVFVDEYEVGTSFVPEPASAALLGLGALACFAARRRRGNL